MAIRLDQPLDLENISPAQQLMLDDLQGNILRPHRRDNATLVFIRFADPVAGRRYLQQLASIVTSEAEQIGLTRRLAESDLGFSGRLFLSIGLTYAGYLQLQISDPNIPRNPAFREGLKVRGPVLLRDPKVEAAEGWETKYREDIHAVLIIAHDTAAITESHKQLLLDKKPPGVDVLGEEIGCVLRNKTTRRAIEHFGFADGMSSLCFFVQDVPSRSNSNWSPLRNLSLALEKCPGGVDASYGSYLVFRKLEQNAKLFAEMERALAHSLSVEPHVAGAKIIGRRKDGVSLVLESGANGSEISNDFNYTFDRKGLACPLQSHVRKMNPRGSTVPTNEIYGAADELQHGIVRRSIPYGTRKDDIEAVLDPKERPATGVGLLFMCCQSSIDNQFEVMQGKWANDPWFPDSSEFSGVDPLIGQRIPFQLGQEGTQVPKWADSGGGLVPFHLRQCVAMKGGEYFFLPSISFLREIEDRK